MSEAASTKCARRSRITRAAATSLIAVAGGLLLSELIVARFMPVYLHPSDYFDDFYIPDDELGYVMKPNFRGHYVQDFEDSFEFNAHGLRDREYGPAKPGSFRILAVGDSYTFGDGVRADQTWSKQLESSLRRRGIAAEVINAGTSGYGTLQYAKLARRLYPIYNPDMLIVMTTFNDPGNDLATSHGIFPPLKIGQHPFKRWLKRHSHLSMRIWLAYLQLAIPKFSFSEADDLYRQVDAEGEAGRRSRAGFELFEKAVDDLIAQAREAGTRILFVSSSDADHPFTRYVMELCRDRQAPFVDGFARVTSGESEVSMAGHTSAGHWSPEGHAEIGEVLAISIAESLDRSRGAGPTP
jgi:lysophospholipase L1-like esterase